jgi:phage terminase small subunit
MTLSVRQLKFVEGVALGKSHAEAARAAGYSPQYARRAAERVLKSKGVQEAIETTRERNRKNSEWTADRYLRELERGAKVAEEKDQMTAYASLMQTLGKATGLLIDRMDINHRGVDLVAAINEARARVVRHAPPAIDTTFTEVPADPARKLLED